MLQLQQKMILNTSFKMCIGRVFNLYTKSHLDLRSLEIERSCHSFPPLCIFMLLVIETLLFRKYKFMVKIFEEVLIPILGETSKFPTVG